MDRLPDLGPDLVRSVASVVRDVASGAAARRRRRLPSVVSVNPEGPTTDLDIWAQLALLRRLGALFPADAIVAEESGLQMQRVPDGAGIWTWVIDPIDGTTSMALGFDTWGTQVALCHEGRAVGAWIACPDLGWELSACDGTDLTVSGVNRAIGPERVVAGQGDFETSHRRRLSSVEVPPHRGTRSCAVDYAQLAAGWLDAVIFRRTNPWDHVPGAYLASRAGARVVRWDDSPYSGSVLGEGILVTAPHAPPGLASLLLPRPRSPRSVERGSRGTHTK